MVQPQLEGEDDRTGPGRPHRLDLRGRQGHHDRLTDNLTRVLLVIEYYPSGFFEKTGNIWRAQGRRARLDLKNFVRFITIKGEAEDGWRGEIRDGEVVRSHEDALAEEESEEESEEERPEGEEAEDEYAEEESEEDEEPEAEYDEEAEDEEEPEEEEEPEGEYEDDEYEDEDEEVEAGSRR